MLCAYGCNQEGEFTLSNGKKCCSKHYNQCPIIRSKNSKGVTKAHKNGKIPTSQLNREGVRNWAKGKTSFTDSRIKSRYNSVDERFETSITGKGLKQILIIERGYKCEKCGLSEWSGEKIVLEMDHINGKRTDNKRENLKLLCPNCHSQTNTWRGRNIKNKAVKATYVSDLDLYKSLLENKTIRQGLLNVGLRAAGANYERAYKVLEKYKK